MELKVKSRKITGKKLKSIRKEGLVPAIVYGNHLKKPIMVSFEKNDFIKIYKQGGSSTTINIKGDKINELVLVQDIQTDPVTDYVLHVDLHAIKSDEKVSVDVSIVLEGVSSVEKLGLGKIQLVRDSVEVEALPQDLPHDISIDISKIENINDIIFVKDLDLGKKVKMLTDPDQAVVTVVAVTDEEEVVEESDTTEESDQEKDGENNNSEQDKS